MLLVTPPLPVSAPALLLLVLHNLVQRHVSMAQQVDHTGDLRLLRGDEGTVAVLLFHGVANDVSKHASRRAVFQHPLQPRAIPIRGIVC